MEKLHTYINGSFTVYLFPDGTKVRIGEGTTNFPESIDLKITDYCDGNCPYCHESSSTSGAHAVVEKILQIVHNLPPGVEVAIGGGNPLSFPKLSLLLLHFKNQGLVSNITVNEKHLLRDPENITRLENYQKEKKIYGVGISVSSSTFNTYNKLKDVVFHIILGEMNPFDIMDIERPCKVLLLGDKRYGRGKEYFKNDEMKINRWRYFLPAVLQREGLHVSFDNLAIEQLKLQDILPEKVWEESYMGDDGQFTMYVDAVKIEYAKSSTSKRLKLGEKSAAEVFKDWQKKRDPNPVELDPKDDKWYFWDETWTTRYGPYNSEAEAIKMCTEYCKEHLGDGKGTK